MTEQRTVPELKIWTLDEWLDWIPDTVKLQPQLYFDRVFGCDVDQVVDAFNQALQDYFNTAFESHGIRRKLDLRTIVTYFLSYDPNSGLKRGEEGRLLQEFVQRGYASVKFIPGAVEAIRELISSNIIPRFLTSTPGALDVSGNHGNRFGSGDAQAARQQRFLQYGLIESIEDIDFVDSALKADRMRNREYIMPFGVDDRISTLASWLSDYGIVSVGIRNEWTPSNHGWEKTGGGLIWFDSLAAAVPWIKEYMLVLDYLGLVRPYSRYMTNEEDIY